MHNPDWIDALPPLARAVVIAGIYALTVRVVGWMMCGFPGVVL